MRLTVASILLAAALLALSATALAGSKPHLIGNCAKPQFKPANVILACGDASLGATGVSWTSWTQKAAVGSGTGQLNDCNPDCVHGKVKTAPMSLRASKPRTCSNGRRIFTKLAYTWTAGAPVGNTPDSGSVPVGCKLLNI
jgi:hypothetical protein